MVVEIRRGQTKHATWLCCLDALKTEIWAGIEYKITGTPGQYSVLSLRLSSRSITRRSIVTRDEFLANTLDRHD